MTNPRGRFGIHGGQYIPETLMNAVIELEKAYDRTKTTRISAGSLSGCSTNTRAALPGCISPKK